MTLKIKSTSEVLEELNLTEKEYYNACKVSDDNSFQLHHKQPTDSFFVNNYFDLGLIAWEGNIDSQSVFDYYKGDESSQTMN